MRFANCGRALSALALLILSTAAWRSAPAAEPTGDLDGFVTDSTTGVPLAGAEVLLTQGGQIVREVARVALGNSTSPPRLSRCRLLGLLSWLLLVVGHWLR